MKNDESVETYLKWIRRNLHGIERDSIDSIVEELQGHINEKAQDRAEEKGMKRPDGAIYEQVLEELGPPEEVAIDYLRILPKRPGTGLRAFLGLQFAIGLLALILGLNEFVMIGTSLAGNGEYNSYYLVMALVGTVFVVVSLATMALVYIQLKRPGLIVHYHAGSILLSLTLAAGILFVMLGYLVWRFVNKDMNYEETTAIAMPVFLALIFAYMVGLKSSEEFQRRISLEEIDNKQFEAKRTASRNTMFAIVAVSMILVSATGVAMMNYNETTFHEKQLVSTDHIGGKYDASIEHWSIYSLQEGRTVGFDRVVYTMNGTKHEGAVLLEVEDAVAWIKNNTESNATVMCWWDYGHQVRALGERNTVIANPSQNLKATMADPDSVKEWDEQAKVESVAKAFTADKVSTTTSIMNQTGAKYLMSSSRDAQGIAYAFYKAAGLNVDDYIKTEYPSNPHMVALQGTPTAKGEQTTLYKIWLDKDLPGLKLVYSDVYTRIYKIE